MLLCIIFRASIDSALYEGAPVFAKNGEESEGKRGKTCNDT